MAPFFMDRVQLPEIYNHFQEAVYFLPFSPYHSNSWYSFHQPQKDERLSRPCSHPVVLNMGPLDWESSALTTRPLLHRRRVESKTSDCSSSVFSQFLWFFKKLVLMSVTDVESSSFLYDFEILFKKLLII